MVAVSRRCEGPESQTWTAAVEGKILLGQWFVRCFL